MSLVDFENNSFAGMNSFKGSSKMMNDSDEDNEASPFNPFARK